MMLKHLIRTCHTIDADRFSRGSRLIWINVGFKIIHRTFISLELCSIRTKPQSECCIYGIFLPNIFVQMISFYSAFDALLIEVPEVLVKCSSYHHIIILLRNKNQVQRFGFVSLYSRLLQGVPSLHTMGCWTFIG